MSKLSESFTREEFACKCGKCKQDAVDSELITVLQRIRTSRRRPVVITSGNRCRSHNKKVGGKPSSQHILSKAADFYVEGESPDITHKVLTEWYKGKYGIGLYSGWVHLDVRSEEARWEE